MGKGGGKSKGKIAFTIVGAALGFYGVGMHWFGAIGVWSGAMMGASIASTLWTVSNANKLGNINSNFDSDYSQDDYSRFDTVTNDVNQNACIPVIYGTRKYGGLQTWHNPYNGNRYLQKDVVVCESGIEGVYDVKANEELIKDDTNISIYNIQYSDAYVKRSGNTLILYAGGTTTQYSLGNVDNYNAQTSMLSTIIDKIKNEAGNGWKIDGAVDDRTSKGISADTMQFNNSNPCYCYCDPSLPDRKNMVILDNRGYTIGTYTVYQNTTPDNYMEVGGYPNLTWIRSNLTASSRLSGSNPTINAIIKGMKVKVCRGNTWTIEYSENPAWIIRDFLISTRYGTGKWITEDMLDDDSFKEVAEYCDEEIEYLDANEELQKCPRYRLNIILDSKKSPIEHLSSMLAVFGGFITFGSLISLKVEKAETPVYEFDDNTIVKDSMSIGQTSLDDTPNRYKIGYFDPNQLWTETKVIVEDLELQEEQQGKITEKTVTLSGCTSQNQALRIGRLYRDLNKVCSLTCSFSVATQGMMLECGDVITVTYGGIFSKMPFRITEIQETNSGTYQLTCRQYNHTIYNDTLGASITNPSYVNNKSPYSTTPPSINNVFLKENTITTNDGKLQIGMNVQWDSIYYQYFDHYEISYSLNDSDYVIASRTLDNNIYISNLAKGRYKVAVKVVSKEGIKSSPVVGYIELKGIDINPPDVTALNCVKLANGTLQFWWDFEYPIPNDIAGFEFRYNQGANVTWDNANPLHTGLVTEQPFETQALRQGIHTVMIRAVDNNNNYSSGMANAILNLGDLLEENVLYKANALEDNWKNTVHTGVINNKGYLTSSSDSFYWLDINTPMWTNPNSLHWSESYKYFELSFQVTAPASGQMWLKYDIDGASQIEYRIVGLDNYWKEENSLYWNEYENSSSWIDNKEMLKPYTGKSLVKAGDTIQVFIKAPNNSIEATIIKELTLIIDVPDRQEHFEDIEIPINGLILPIVTPNYYTTAVRLDAVQNTNNNIARAVVIERNPCIIKLIDNNGQPISAKVDVTWQGFQKEVI